MSKWLRLLWTTPHRLTLGFTTPLVVGALMTAIVQAQPLKPPVTDPVATELSELTQEELAAEPSDGLAGESLDGPIDLSAFESGFGAEAPPPVAAKDASGVQITPSVEGGYRDAEGRLWVDVLEKDIAYFEVRLFDKDDRPVEGATPTIRVQGSSKVIAAAEASSMRVTDDSGYSSFDIVAGNMGMDTVTVAFANATSDIFVNIISLEAAGFPSLPELKDGVAWPMLMSASLAYDGDALTAEFSDAIKSLAGKTVKIAGFMVPLESALKQSRFLLTSNPPSCFFHVPGGPAGAVEVLAKTGIEASWDPIVLEGKFEPLSRSEDQVVYRLTNARVVEP